MKKILALLCAICFMGSSFLTLNGYAEITPTPANEAVEENLTSEDNDNEEFNDLSLPEDAAIVAKVNGVEIFGREINRLFHNITREYAMYGLDFSDASLLEEVLQLAYNSVIQKHVLLQNAASLGVHAPTGEALETLQASVKERHQAAVNAWIEELTPENATDAEKESAQKEVEAELVKSNMTLEEVLAREIETVQLNQVQEAIIKDLTVSEEEIQEQYKVNVEADKIVFESDILPYEQSMMSGEMVWFVPAGYRGIKHILLDVEEELLNNYNQIKAVYEEQSAIHEDGSDKNVEEGASVITEEQIVNAENLILDSVKDSLSAIESRLAQGESFDSLVAEFGKDPGMLQEPTKSIGYQVHKDSYIYDPVFTKTAFTLENIGDYSKAVIGSYGVHILYYNGDIPEGPVALDGNKQLLEEEALLSKQQLLLKETIDNWTKASNIEVLDSRFKNIED